MVFQGILIANRGEIAIRIARAAAELGIKSVAIYSEDDASSLHTKIADESFLLPGLGAAAYLNMEEVINAAKKSGCDAIHPGYGFLSEQASFAEKCAEAGLTFIGPKYLATLGGIVFLSHQSGAIFGAWAGGKIFDTYGSYDNAWWISVFLGFTAFLFHIVIQEKPFRIENKLKTA